MSNRKTIEISYKVTTPMFLSGSEHDISAELRPPSFKGALRFWYRAIDKDFHDHERAIFGSSDKGFGQSQFLLQISEKKIRTQKASAFNGLQYLGYGVSGDDARFYIKEECTFKLKIMFKPQVSDDNIKLVQQAIWAMTMFGGLGARSRKGLGSITATKVSGMDGHELPTLMPKSKLQLERCVQEFIQNHISKTTMPLPDHSCWSNSTRCVVFASANSGTRALQELQRILHKYRSSQSDDCFDWAIHDRDRMRAFADTGILPTAPPLRASFGLPHNYFFSDLATRYVDVNLMNGNTDGRRGSPLFFSVHQLPDNRTHIVATFLKAKFLPDDGEITLTSWKKVHGSKQIQNQDTVPFNNDFTAITDILDKLNTPEHQGTEIS